MFIDALETIFRAEGAGGFWRVQGYKHVASNEAKTRKTTAIHEPHTKQHEPKYMPLELTKRKLN